MKKIDRIRICTVFLLFNILLVNAKSDDRYFHTHKRNAKEIIITVLHPSIGVIRSLLELKREHLLLDDNLTVVGVYHAQETTDYKSSIAFVKKRGVDWFKFHKVSGPLTQEQIFKKNNCTSDFELIFKNSDGIIFFGGADIPPSVYENKTNLLTSINTPYRHFFELSFIFHLMGGYQNNGFKPLMENAPELPVLGICLGEQSLNVGTGGTLIQDIWFEKYKKSYVEDIIELGKEKWHNNPYRILYPRKKLLRYNIHRIRLLGGGKFVSQMGFSVDDTPYIISSHHQAVKRLGKGMRVIATSLDGRIVEAIEHTRFPNVLGIQFHTDFTILWDSEKMVRICPEEKVNINSFLKSNPPSFKFNKTIWSWFVEKVRYFHNKSLRTLNAKSEFSTKR